MTISAAEYRRMMGLDKQGRAPRVENQPRSQGRSKSGSIVARARRPRPGRSYDTEKMNQTEARYAEHLNALLRTGRVMAWAYEAVKLRLADKTFYTPDFLVVTADGGMELHEVKGHWEDDARVKIKVAATMHPWFRFLAVKAGKSGWDVERFGANTETICE